ncbi:MAG: copper homeostasis protein CutC [Microbacterium sp.]
MSGLLLDVVATTVEDVQACHAGGADCVELAVDLDSLGRTPPLELVGAACSVSDIEIRVMLRSGPGPLSARALDEQLDVARRIASLPVGGLVFGFLTPEGLLDLVTARAVAEAIAPLPWTLHRAFDQAGCPGLDDLESFGLDRVLSAGGPGSLDDHRAATERRAAVGLLPRRMIAAGRARLDHVRWATELGMAGIHVGDAVRDSWTTPVDPRRVEAFRLAIDRL